MDVLSTLLLCIQTALIATIVLIGIVVLLVIITNVGRVIGRPFFLRIDNKSHSDDPQDLKEAGEGGIFLIWCLCGLMCFSEFMMLAIGVREIDLGTQNAWWKMSGPERRLIAAKMMVKMVLMGITEGMLITGLLGGLALVVPGKKAKYEGIKV